MRASEAITAAPENIPDHHEEAFCLERRNPYSIRAYDDRMYFAQSAAEV
jgi:hypothetical protein